MASIFLINWETRLSSESRAGRGRWGELKLKAKPNEALVIVKDPGLGLTLRKVKLFCFPFLHLFPIDVKDCNPESSIL